MEFISNDYSRLVFMGTPDFAVPSLKKIAGSITRKFLPYLPSRTGPKDAGSVSPIPR